MTPALWETVGRLFNDVAECDEAECEARLRAAEPGVRAEVRALLAAERAAGASFASPDPLGRVLADALSFAGGDSGAGSEARPADPSALGALLGPGVAPAAPAAGSSASHPAEARLGTTPGQAGFAEQLGAQLSTFMREGVQHARLQLHPLELGPVTVQIQLDGGSAHLSFAAEHALTRQALEQALPALAGSLREAGLTLSGGGVFEQPRQPQPDGDGGRGDGTGSRGGRGGTGSGDDALKAPTPGPALRRRGVVDLVA